MIFIAVAEEVFEECSGLPVLGIITLEAFDERNGHGAVEERVFAIHLFTAAPTRVAREVSLRSQSIRTGGRTSEFG